MRLSSSGFAHQAEEGEKKYLNSELWHACAGPLVSLPPVGGRVVYFPQGHSEQVAVSTNKDIDGHIPNYPNLPPQLICQLHDVTMHADVETDEVYAQMTLQPLTPQEQKDVSLLPAELGTPNKQPTNYFCKTLTASDTSTHGGFSVPRRAAEKVFPPLDFSQTPPVQELVARDIHDNEWKFRHIFRGQPKRHLLTTGWSVFVSAKRLVAGDAVIFIWNEKNQLLLGIRHANRSQTVVPSSVLSSDSMHIGLLAAAAHAAATNSRFTIFYNPRASPSDFIVPLAKYVKAVYHTRVSVGMRFRMLFETEESSVRRYMGTITGIGDLDPRWPNSHWRSVKVGWDESTAGERQPRVSLWEIEPLTTFPMYPSPFPLRLKRPWPSGLPSFPALRDGDTGLSSQLMWLQRDYGDRCLQPLNSQGFGPAPWMQPRLESALLGLQPDAYQMMASSILTDSVGLANKRPNQSVLQFQQNQGVCTQPTVTENQILQQAHVQSQQSLMQSFQGIQAAQSQQQNLLLQQQMQNCGSYEDQQRQHQQTFQQLEQLNNQYSGQCMSKFIPKMGSVVSSSSSQTMTPQTGSSRCAQPTSSRPAGCSDASPIQSLLNSSQDVGSRPFNMSDSSLLVSPGSLTSKRVAAGPQFPCNTAQSIEESAVPPSRISELSTVFSPFSSREFSAYQDVGGLQNNFSFGSRMEQSELKKYGDNGTGNRLFGANMQRSECANLRDNCTENNSLPVPYPCSGFPGSAETDFPPGSDMTTASCVDESGFLQSSEHVDQANPTSGTFVKVYKSGSFGRSLDMSKFSSYHELRSELARMFGLEGRLEDPLRSGWQLVFVDRENDILLLGDDPWQEFVNSVWYIKILSPQEVQQMGKEELNLPNPGSEPKLNNNVGDGYASQEASTNGSGLSSMASFNY